MDELLDETVRQSCNELGGYWVTVATFEYDGHRGMKRTIWVCRMPGDVIEKAAGLIKQKRGYYDSIPPCHYFNGEHRYFTKKEYPPMDFKRLGFPEGTEQFTVCDIPYENWKWDKKYPLTDTMTYHVIESLSHPPKEKIYDNYNPDFPTLLILPDKNHYHINYEGSQEKLYNRLKEYIGEDVKKTNNREIHPHPYRNSFMVTENHQSIFEALIYPGLNAAPRIKILKGTDDFNNIIYKAVFETKTEGQMVGKPPYWDDKTFD